MKTFSLKVLWGIKGFKLVTVKRQIRFPQLRTTGGASSFLFHPPGRKCNYFLNECGWAWMYGWWQIYYLSNRRGARDFLKFLMFLNRKFRDSLRSFRETLGFLFIFVPGHTHTDTHQHTPTSFGQLWFILIFRIYSSASGVVTSPV